MERFQGLPETACRSGRFSSISHMTLAGAAGSRFRANRTLQGVEDDDGQA